MKKFVLLLCIFVSTCCFNVNAYSSTISPVTVTATSTTIDASNSHIPEHLIDGSGLDTSNDTHGYGFWHMWMTANGVTTADLTFDLGSNHDVTSIQIWNYNFDDNGGYNGFHRGAKNIELWYQNDGNSFDLKAQDLFVNKATSLNEQGQIFDLTHVMTARYVTFRITDNWEDNTVEYDNHHTGLSEVRFYDDAVSPVPEPATMLLFGLGLLCLAGVNRRKIA